MTRKHFEAIARAISFATSYRDSEILDKGALVGFLVGYLKAENPRFNEDKFREACDLPYSSFGTNLKAS